MRKTRIKLFGKVWSIKEYSLADLWINDRAELIGGLLLALAGGVLVWIACAFAYCY